MALIKSISGIRGTIGGRTDDNLTPLDTVKFTSSYGAWLLKENPGKDRLRVVVGRDARISGPMVHALVTATLSGMGIDVIDLGLSTTPTVEMMVVHHQADGGIIITASHNPKQWNALKLLNRQGEFLDAEQGAEILRTAQADDYTYAEVDRLGTITSDLEGIDRHIEKVLALPAVDRRAIAEAGFKVVVDAVNSTGGIAIPKLLRALGVTDITELNCTPDGHFAHNPEPLKENLEQICRTVADAQADMGIVVDPDVDRLAFIDEHGEMFGEEYTLVAVADYILSRQKGDTASNLSSSRALADVTAAHGGHYQASAVGEVNVVALMKKNGVFIAHSPESNMNLASGVAPINKFLDNGLRVGLATDVAGGSHESMLRAMTHAIQASKLRWRLYDQDVKPLSFERAFYLATMGGGAFFGNVGSFLEGYEFDAVVLDDASLDHPQELSVRARLERAAYLADDRNLTAKFVAGQKILG